MTISFKRKPLQPESTKNWDSKS